MLQVKIYDWAERLLPIFVMAAFWGAYLSVSLIGLGVFMSLVCVLLLLPSPSARVSVLNHPLLIPVLVLSGSILVSIILAEPYPFQKPLEKVGYLFALFPFTYSFQRHPEQREKILKSCLFFSVLLSGLAAGQFLGLFQSWNSFLTHHSKLLSASGRPFFLATGLTFHHTPFAATLTWAFHIILAHSFFSRSSRKQVVFATGAVLCVLGILFSCSRGVWVALFFSTCLSVGLFNWKKLIPLAVLGGLSFLVLFSVVPEFHTRILSIQFSENPERLLLWKTALRMFQDTPFFGQGYHSFGSRLTSFIRPEELYPNFPTEAHNMYLDFLATTGIVGFLSFCFFIAQVLTTLFRAWFHFHLSEWERPWILATLGGFVAFLIAGFFDRHFYMSQTLVPNLVALAITSSIVSAYKH